MTLPLIPRASCHKYLRRIRTLASARLQPCLGLDRAGPACTGRDQPDARPTRYEAADLHRKIAKCKSLCELRPPTHTCERDLTQVLGEGASNLELSCAYVNRNAYRLAGRRV